MRDSAVSRQFDPYFDQEDPICLVKGLVACLDISPSYEMDAAAVFKCDRGYLVVFVSGCSCWPDRGYTEQIVCARKADVDRTLTGEYRRLLQKCQDAEWKITQRLNKEDKKSW